MQHALFDDLPLPQPPGLRTGADARRRWWRLHGRARREGRGVEPLLVTPRLAQRIEQTHCPVTREPLARADAQIVALRPDAAFAAGHLALLSGRAAGAPAGRWLDAWSAAQRLEETRGAGAVVDDPAEGALSAAEWRRLAVLRAFVAGPSAMQAAGLPLLVLPPPRLRVLSPVQALQVALTLALAEPDRARCLAAVPGLMPASGRDAAAALRTLVLTLLARAPALPMAPAALRHALEDLWADPLLARRWRRAAERLDDPAADALLDRARREGLLGRGWRPMALADAVDGWADEGPRLQ